MTGTATRPQAARQRNAGHLQREMRGPDLEALIRSHGTYDRITPEAWATYDRDLALWRLRTAVGDFHRPPYRRHGVR
jgi:hypothetical protein